MDDRSAKYRAFFAQLICAAAKSTDPRLERAFRSVRREPFAGPGPWSISFGGHPYVMTPDDDPAFLYQNALLALDPARGVNIGMPGAHAYWLSGTAVKEGEIVLQIGAGTGYYTAILAELAGPKGRVYAYEIDERLARLARENLKDIATVELRERSGIASDLPSVDVIYVCAGAAQPATEWLEALRPGGRLVFPLAPEGMLGGMLMITRPEQGAAWPAKFLSRAQFIGCAGLQDAEAGKRLAEAFARGWEVVQSFRRGDAPDETCWFAGDGWWLSTAPAAAQAASIPVHGDITQA
jgi:protein-L-isoaspartate(D-aspartate) O-methyltransferase